MLQKWADKITDNKPQAHVVRWKRELFQRKRTAWPERKAGDKRRTVLFTEALYKHDRSGYFPKLAEVKIMTMSRRRMMMMMMIMMMMMMTTAVMVRKNMKWCG